jgi:hypothetical protein
MNISKKPAISLHFFTGSDAGKNTIQPCKKNKCLLKADAKISALILIRQIFF